MGEEEQAPCSLQELLLSYAWCVELTLEHLHRLHFAMRSKRTVEYALERLTDAGWIERHERRGTSRLLHSEKASGRRFPAVWSLTSQGHAQIKRLEAYPFKDSKGQYPAKVGKARSERLREHDLLLSDLVVELVDRGRERGLSGVFVGRELRLDVERARPLMDALLLLHFHDMPCAPNLVPWTKDKATTQEQTLRYAIELDTGSEAIATVVKKAEEYAAIIRPDNRAWFDWWYPRYGARPFVLLVLPENEARFETVFEGWARAWPNGAWAMTTPQRLREDRWVIYDAQTGGRAEWSVFPLSKPTNDAPAVRSAPASAVPPTQNPTAREGQILEVERREEAEEAPVEVPRPAEPVPVVRQQPVAPLTLALAALSGPGTVTLPHRPFLPAPTEEDYREADRAHLRRRYGPLGVWLILALRWMWASLWALAGWIGQWLLPRLWAALRLLAGWMWRWVCQSPQRATAVLLAFVLLALSVWLVRAQPWREWRWPAVVQTTISQTEPTPVPAVMVIPTATPPMPACGQVQVTAQRVNLRVTPGLGKHAEVLRKLTEGEVLWRLCDAVQAADGHTWQRVLGETDVLPGWVAVEYLRVVEPPE